MHFGVNGYTTPVHDFSQLQGTNPMAMMAVAQAQNPQGAQNPPGGHFDQGGAIAPKKPTKITLTPQEAAFCRRLGISYAKFALHKASLPL
jgi:hypothetical protein